MKDNETAAVGTLPLTTSGTPSYALAKAAIRMEVDEMLFQRAQQYGLTYLEVTDILTDMARSWLVHAVQEEQAANRPGLSR